MERHDRPREGERGARGSTRAPVGRVVAFVFGAALALTGAARAATASDWSYTYAGAERALALDHERFVVRHTFADAALVEVPLAKVGLVTGPMGGVLPWHVPGTASVSVPPGLSDPARLVETIAAVAVEDGIVFASPRLVDADGNGLVPTDELLVAFDATVGHVLARQILLPYGEVIERNPGGLADTYRVRTEFRCGFDVLAAARALSERPETLWCDPNFMLEVARAHVPNDPLFPSQWSLANTGQMGGPGGFDLDAPSAWDITTGSASIVVAVLDDGVEQNHPDLSQVPGADFTGSGTGGGPAQPCDRHGTAVAGCIAAGIDNGLGTTGVAPNARVMGLKVFTTSSVCNGQGAFQVNWFLDALEHCRANGVRVTNTSLGFAPMTSITQKFDTTRAEGLVHFASSGNSGGAIGYPASAPSVNAIGAIAADGSLASFSCFGPEQAFTAPGQVVWTTDRSGADGYAGAEYTTLSGTSFASPFAAGVAALVLSVDPTLTASAVESLLAATALDLGSTGTDDAFGHGLLRAGAAVNAAAAALSTSSAPAITALDPVAVPVLVPDGGGTFAILGTDLTNATGVRVGATTLPASDVTVVDDGRIEVRYTGLPWLGPVDVEVLHAGGSDVTQIASVAVSAPAIEVTDSWPDGLDRALGMQVAVASQPFDLVYSIASLVRSPTNVPGVIASDLGGGDITQLFLLSVSSIDPTSGVTRFAVPISALPLGLDVHLQAGVIEFVAPALPLVTTNVQSGTVQF